MKEHKGLRDYHEQWRRLGIQNPGEVRFGDPIQFVATVDDVSHLVPPLLVPVCDFQHSGAGPGAGIHAGIQLTAGGRGVWLTLVYEFLAQQIRVLYPGVTSVVGAALTPSAVGPLFTSQLNAITITAAQIATVPNQTIMRPSETRPFSVFLERGQRVQVVTSVANAPFGVGLGFREVPARGPDPTP